MLFAVSQCLIRQSDIHLARRRAREREEQSCLCKISPAARNKEAFTAPRITLLLVYFHLAGLTTRLTTAPPNIKHTAKRSNSATLQQCFCDDGSR